MSNQRHFCGAGKQCRFHNMEFPTILEEIKNIAPHDECLLVTPHKFYQDPIPISEEGRCDYTFPDGDYCALYKSEHHY